MHKKGALGNVPDLAEPPKMQTLLSLAFGAVSISIIYGCKMAYITYFKCLFSDIIVFT